MKDYGASLEWPNPPRALRQTANKFQVHITINHSIQFHEYYRICLDDTSNKQKYVMYVYDFESEILKDE